MCQYKCSSTSLGVHLDLDLAQIASQSLVPIVRPKAFHAKRLWNCRSMAFTKISLKIWT